MKPKPDPALDRKALDLKRAGVTYDVIAERLDLGSRAAATRAVRRGLEATGAEDDSAERTIELDRLDRVLVAVWAAAMKGDAKAVDQVLKISERRARLLGLDVVASATPPKPRLIWEEEV